MKTILVVDDSPLIRKAIRRIIEPMGFHVDEAEQGLDALSYLEAGHQPDAVLLDVEMPEMDGLTFLKTLRTSSDLPQPPVIMCTTVHAVATIAEAYSVEPDVIYNEALQSGADEYIMKPFNEAILSEKLGVIGLVA